MYEISLRRLLINQHEMLILLGISLEKLFKAETLIAKSLMVTLVLVEAALTRILV